MPQQYAVGQRRLERKRTSRKKVMSILKNMIRMYFKVQRGTNGLSNLLAKMSLYVSFFITRNKKLNLEGSYAFHMKPPGRS
jgi:hypothetical protein